MQSTNPKRAAVLGWPITHSLSPRLHEYWLKKHGIHGTYEAITVSPGDLKGALARLAQAGYAGFNVTIPYKEEVFALMNDVDPIARRMSAINTVVIRGGKFYGTNTDAYGFVQNLKAHGVRLEGGHALVVGAGGAARAICVGLLDNGMHVTVTNRTRARADDLTEAFGGIRVIEWKEAEAAMGSASLLVNTTALGMQGMRPLELSLYRLPAEAVVADIVYRPLETPLLAEARQRGLKTVDGLGMLLWQAQPGFRAWFGVEPEVTDELREHVLQGMSGGE